MTVRTDRDENRRLDEFTRQSYNELRRLAARLLRRHRSRSARRATSLVHETYLKLAASSTLDYHGSRHFYRTAARAMRMVLVDEIRRRNSQKRGAAHETLRLDDVAAEPEPSQIDLLALDDALNELEATDPRRASIVELRYFGGLSVDEVAEVLGISAATVKRQWPLARAFLCRELRGE